MSGRPHLYPKPIGKVIAPGSDPAAIHFPQGYLLELALKALLDKCLGYWD